MKENQLDFAWNVHQYLRDFIQFADTKAGFVFAWCNGVLVVLAGRESVTPLFALAKWSQQPVAQLLTLIAISLLAAGAVASILTIYPTLASSIPGVADPLQKHQGIIYWGDIRAQNEEDYVSQVAGGDEQAKSVARHCYTLAGIATRKYRFLRFAMAFAFIGSGFGSMVFVLGF